MLWKRFNDQLVLVLLTAIVGLWVGQGRGWLVLPGEVVGALITAFGMLVMFYYRKKEGETATDA